MTATDAVSLTRQRLGRIGVWVQGQAIRSSPPDVRRRQAARIEELGYRSVWTGETPGGSDVFVQLATLLAGTDRLVAGSGIANIWSRPALTAHAAANAVVDAYPDRFVLGLGVGYAVQANMVGADYGKPLATMRRYLDALDAALGDSLYQGQAAAVPTVLAAVGPKMLALATERTDGAHPYAQPVANTIEARKVLGPDKLLIPEQAVVVDDDPATSRRLAREYRERTRVMAARIGLNPTDMPYGRNLLRLGYSVEDVTGNTDRLVDDLIAHGDETRVAARIAEHLAAGADHVLVHPIGDDLVGVVDVLERLAPALLELAG